MSGEPGGHGAGTGLGRPLLHLRRTGSTNDRARELAIAGAPHGTLVTASEQTAGRGRQGRVWSAPAGSALLASLVLRSPPPLLALISAVAVCDVAGAGAQIKWPNDIVLAHGGGSEPALSKLAGILIEGRPQEGWAVLGIGLNVAVRPEQFSPELRRSAATLGLAPDAIESILAALLQALQRRLAEPDESILEAWRERDALRGREIAWGQAGDTAPTSHGRAEGVDGAGRLIIALPGGSHTSIDAGEVHLVAVA